MIFTVFFLATLAIASAMSADEIGCERDFWLNRFISEAGEIPIILAKLDKFEMMAPEIHQQILKVHFQKSPASEVQRDLIKSIDKTIDLIRSIRNHYFALGQANEYLIDGLRNINQSLPHAKLQLDMFIEGRFL
ncbi:uncharacterized protein LOC141856452 [Brevipalpus obovatus]|uniref:uncharacterized protein LOC141856452 n=1 Tax=Brevipalpus obovatus TaxID=246614 RepID=UPI003D9DBD8D